MHQSFAEWFPGCFMLYPPVEGVQQQHQENVPAILLYNYIIMMQTKKFCFIILSHLTATCGNFVAVVKCSNLTDRHTTREKIGTVLCKFQHVQMSGFQEVQYSDQISFKQRVLQCFWTSAHLMVALNLWIQRRWYIGSTLALLVTVQEYLGRTTWV